MGGQFGETDASVAIPVFASPAARYERRVTDRNAKKRRVTKWHSGRSFNRSVGVRRIRTEGVVLQSGPMTIELRDGG